MSCPTDSQDTARAEPSPLAPTTTDAKPNAIGEAAAQSPETYEAEHVHSVYESIAGHFSSTRYKPWPFIASFLRERVTTGSVGLDVGCGNGKYLGVRSGSGSGEGEGGSSGSSDVHIVGSDRSPSLVRIARGRGFEVAVADGLALPFRRRAADFALCIAVIHHLSTRARRVDALRGLLECVREDGGQVLVYVWALEQGAGSRRGWDATSDQDQLVPWVMKANQNSSSSKKKKKEKSNSKKGGKGDDKSPVQTHNQTQTQTQIQSQGQGVAASADGDCDDASVGSGAPPADAPPAADTTYERFYHLYREGELEEDMRAAGGAVLESGYERDNWWVIGGPRGR